MRNLGFTGRIINSTEFEIHLKSWREVHSCKFMYMYRFFVLFRTLNLYNSFIYFILFSLFTLIVLGKSTLVFISLLHFRRWRTKRIYISAHRNRLRRRKSQFMWQGVVQDGPMISLESYNRLLQLQHNKEYKKKVTASMLSAKSSHLTGFHTPTQQVSQVLTLTVHFG